MINAIIIALQYTQQCVNDTEDNIQAFNDIQSSEQLQQFVNNNILTVPCGVTEINNQVQLYGDKDKLTHIIIPDTVQIIQSWAFSNCASLQTISLPPLLQQIKAYTFYKCYKLKSIKIQNNVKTIEHDAISYCTSLTYITIPQSVTSLGERTFGNCTLLSCVEIQNENCTFYSGNQENTSFAGTMFRDTLPIDLYSEVCQVEEQYFVECNGGKQSNNQNDMSGDQDIQIDQNQDYTYYIGDERRCITRDYVESYMDMDDEKMYVKRCHEKIQYRSDENGPQQCLSSCQDEFPYQQNEDTKVCSRGCGQDKFGTQAQSKYGIQYLCVDNCDENTVWIKNQDGNFCTQSESCENISGIYYSIEGQENVCVANCQILDNQKYLQNQICVQQCNLEIYYKYEQTKQCVSNCKDYNQIQYEKECIDQCPEKMEPDENNICIEQKKQNVGMIIGIVLACVVVCVVIICVIIFIIKKKGKGQQNNNNQMRDNNVIQNE